MSIPVYPCCSRIFDDRVDLFARSREGVPMTLRLSVAGARALALQLNAAASGHCVESIGPPATLDHPLPLPGDAAEPRPPP